jgi:hypothetical protein
VNHSVENCGVYQFGKRVGDILAKSTSIQFIYVEIDSFDALLAKVSEVNPNSILFNHLQGTMPWLNEVNIEILRSMSIKTFTIVHNIGYKQYFDGYFHQDPNFIGDSHSNFAFPRPIFEDYVVRDKPRLEILQIGSFGFGFKVKHFDEICRLVNGQFKNELVQVNFHITESYFSPNASEIEAIERRCRKILKNKNHNLVVTRDFLSNIEILDFLALNDLNVFLYEKYKTYNGISSTLDYALSAKRPFAINKSNMFSHFHDVTPSICIEDLSLHKILENGIFPLEDKYEDWSNANFVSTFEEIISQSSL